jgi:sugar (pentulose or hexulose) kinase
VHVDARAYAPDPSARAAYDDAYGRYRRLFDAVEPTFGGGHAGGAG